MRPTASWRSKVTPCRPPRPHSRQEGTSPRRLSRTSTSALSTGLWCLGSAACYRSDRRLVSDRIYCEIGSSTCGHCSVPPPPLVVTSEHRVVLSQCVGVALLPHRLQKQNWFTSGPPAYRPIQLTNAWGKHSLYTAGTLTSADRAEQ